MLVSALMGRERMQAAYAHVIATGYRSTIMGFVTAATGMSG